MANHYTREIPQLRERDLTQLKDWSKIFASKALRATIILEVADGHSDQRVSEKLGISRATVGKWRRRFLKKGFDGLVDSPRSGKPRVISDEQVEEIIKKTLESTPKDGTRWCRKKMAQETGVSSTTIGRIWSTYGLQPHLV